MQKNSFPRVSFRDLLLNEKQKKPFVLLNDEVTEAISFYFSKTSTNQQKQLRSNAFSNKHYFDYFLQMNPKLKKRKRHTTVIVIPLYSNMFFD